MTLNSRTLWLIGLLTITGIVGAWLGYPYHHLWRAIAILLLIAGVFEYRATQAVRLKLSLVQKHTPRLGEPHQCQIYIENQSRGRLKLRSRPLPPDALQGPLQDFEVTLGPGQAEQFSFVQTPQQLGTFSWPGQPIEIQGAFKLARWLRYLPLEDGTSKIEPAMLARAKKRGTTANIGNRQIKVRHMGSNEFHTLRDYVPGDAPAMIDWKTTARKRRTIVRETELEQQLLVFFLIDCGRNSALQVGSMQAISHAVNLVARMAEIAEEAGDHYGVMTYADAPTSQLTPGHGRSHLLKLRALLGNTQTTEVESNPLGAVIPLLKLLPQRALVLMFSPLDDASALSNIQQATALMRPRHLPMIIHIEDHKINELVWAPINSESDVYTAVAAREYIQATQQSRQRLERLGSIVVQAPPERVEEAVFARYLGLRNTHRA